MTTFKTYHGTHRGTFLGVAPTGRKIHFETVDAMRVHDGKIAEHWGVANLFSLMQQLGALPPAKHPKQALLSAASLSAGAPWWLGFVAVISGWVVTGILRSAGATSPIGAQSVATSLLLFILVYAIVFSIGVYYINRPIARGTESRAAESPSPGTSSKLGEGAS